MASWSEQKPPQFGHDCELCRYLGQFDGADLYFCPVEPTVVARRSDRPDDYASGMEFGMGPDPIRPLAEAFRRAIKRGFIKIEIKTELHP